MRSRLAWTRPRWTSTSTRACWPSVASARWGCRRQDTKVALHINERFTGRFRRVVSLPDDIDPNSVTATCRDGVLHISIKRRESAQPRRITIQ